MNPKQPRPQLFALFLFPILFAILTAAPAAAQDAVAVGTVTATGNSVDVPVSIRDISGTALGRDQPAGSRIQAFTIKVSYAPAASVQSVAFTRAGITASLHPAFESSPSSAGQVTLLEDFSESSDLIPFTLNAPPPGDLVAHIVFTLSASAAPGSSIALTLDSSATELTDQGGTPATAESSANSNLVLIDGAINIPSLSLTIEPPSSTVAAGDSTSVLVQASANVTSDKTVTLSSSSPDIASVPSSAVILAGSRSVEVPVTAFAVGSTTITATLSQFDGGASASASVTVTEACTIPAAPQLSGPTTADAGTAYAITWAAVNGATAYIIDEATDQNFGSLTSSSTVTTTSASFTHSAANRYYYRIRARNNSTGCNTTSPFSSIVSVLVTVAPVAQTGFIPVVGSTPGNNGAFFKTSVQLFNPKSSTISGKIVFHPQGVSGTSGDPSLVYSIAEGNTLLYPDLLPAMGLLTSGLGSADIIADAGSPFPVALVRVFNDAGTAGTSGLTEDQMAAADALQSGDMGALIAPPDFQRFRLNIGVRTLDSGVAMTLTVRDRTGVVVKTTTKSYGPNFFIQPGSTTMLDGYVLTGEETISIAVTSGSAFVYGSTTDNITQDPSVQFAKRIE